MALKDKLMTLEDFKAVRDVDVASNSAQFTEIKADLADESSSLKGLKNSLGDGGRVVFTVEANNSHSSKVDRVFLNISNGDKFYLSVLASVNTGTMCTVFGWTAEGTSQSIKTQIMNGTKVEITASADYVAIGIYINAISIAQTYTMVVEKKGFIYDTLSTLSDLDTGITEAQNSVDSLVKSIGVYGKSSFTVAANTAHSSQNDYVSANIPNGTTFYVSISRSKSEETDGTLYVKSADSSPVSLGTIAIDGRRRAYTAPSDLVWVGVYINSKTYAQDYEMRVEMEDSIYVDISESAFTPENEIKVGNVFKNSDASFLFFTDVHGSANNVSRIIEYANKNANNIDCIINGGDVVASNLSSGISWYDNLVSNSDVDILMAVGNHDAWGTESYDKLPATTVYSNYIAPITQRVENLVQPSDAESNGKCYYYKDYGMKLRVIVLNAMTGIESVTYWDADAKSWLESVLADAKTNGKHVICVNHTPFAQSGRTVNTDSSWTSFKTYFDGMVLEPEAVTAVQSFISSGGIFVCWLVGHSHNDAIMTDVNGQLMIQCATAHYPDSYFHSDGYGINYAYSNTYDCFNVCGVDTTNEIFKVARIGWNMDSAMKKRDAFAYDYANKRIITDR